MASQWEAKAGDLRGAGGEPLSQAESLTEGERDAWWAEFDGLTEEEVSGRIDRKFYNEPIAGFAREWLARRQSLRGQDDLRALRAFAQQIKDISGNADRSASEAKEQARASDIAARAAQETAAIALKEARAGAALTLIVAECRAS